MTKDDEPKFYSMLDMLLTSYGKAPKPDVFKFWFALMEKHTIEDCEKAMLKYASTVKYPPVPAGVIELIAGSAGISGDEAWAHVPKLETGSGWMNQRMSQALGCSLSLIDAGDMIAARKTFLAAYSNAEDDDGWFYSRGQGIEFEVAEREKVDQHKLLEDRGWVKPSENINNLRLEMNTNPVLTDENKARAAELVKLTKEIANKA
jgi:hypothetical protein